MITAQMQSNAQKHQTSNMYNMQMQRDIRLKTIKL